MAAAKGITFGAAPAPTTNLFGAAATTGNSFTFGKTATTSASGLSFGSALGSSTASTGLPVFGSTAAKTTGLSTGFGSTSSSLFGGLQSTTTATQPSAFGIGATTGTTSAFGSSLFGKPTQPASVSSGFQLGGAGLTLQSSSAASTATSAGQTGIEPKDHQVAPEFVLLTQELGTHIKEQKLLKEQISRVSPQSVYKVQQEITSLQKAICSVSSGILKDGAAVESLKGEVAVELRNAEIASNVRQLPASMQHDYAAPMGYFQRLVQSFEAKIIECRREIDEVENYLANMSNTDQLSAQNLGLVLKQINDAFILLASQLHSVHEAIKEQKQKYLHHRRLAFGDQSDPFVAKHHKKATEDKKSTLTGPSPFCGVAGPTAAAFAVAFNPTDGALRKSNAPFSAFGQPTQSTASTTGFGTSLFKPTATAGPSGLTRSLSFGGGLNQISSLGAGSSGVGSSLFGKSTGQSLFGNSLGQSAAGSLFGGPASTKIGFNAASQFTNPTPSFQLANPPTSSKRGKK